MNTEVFRTHFDREDLAQYRDKMLVLKGCGDFEIPASCYVYATEKLVGTARSLMFGEPCSTVPVYKQKKSAK